MITKDIAPFEEVLSSLSKFNLTEEEVESCKQGYERIIKILERYTPQDSTHNIYVCLGVFSHHDNETQAICDLSVSDNSLTWQDSYNFHGQNTSRWLFAGGWVFDTIRRDFSLHT